MKGDELEEGTWQLPSSLYPISANEYQPNFLDTPLSLSVNSSLIIDPLTPSSCQSADYVSHCRTSSYPNNSLKLPTTIMQTPPASLGYRSSSFPNALLSGISLTTTTTNGGSNGIIGSSSGIGANSMALSTLPEQQLASPFRVQDEFERQFGALTIDTSPIQQQSRRSTVFSNASVSSAGTSKSIIGSGLTQPSSTNTSSSLQAINQLGIGGKGSTPPSNFLSKEEIMSLSKDQHGCRLLQRKLDEDSADNFAVIFNSILPHSSQLMIDPFGNYLIQKIMTLSNPGELSLIIMEITPNIGTISTNSHGTRAVQKLIDCLCTEDHIKLVSVAIGNRIVELVHDLNGNHVIQKVINRLNGHQLDFLVDLLLINLVPITTHKHGCCVLQKLMTKCSPQQVIAISEGILKNGIYLMKDQFGNYVVQYLISLDLDYVNQALLNLVACDIINLSCGKFSSNVVEKCLRIKASFTETTNFMNPVLISLVSPTVLSALIKDQYGNYVIQTTLDVADWSTKCVLVELMKPLLPGVRYTNYGKRIYNKAAIIANEMERSGIATGAHW